MQHKVDLFCSPLATFLFSCVDVVESSKQIEGWKGERVDGEPREEASTRASFVNSLKMGLEAAQAEASRSCPQLSLRLSGIASGGRTVTACKLRRCLSLLRSVCPQHVHLAQVGWGLPEVRVFV